MTEPLLRFQLRYVERPKDAYYLTRRNKAVAVQVPGTTRDEKVQKLLDILGSPGSHREWAIRL